LELWDEQQTRQWDYFVQKHPCGWLCHLTDWYQILEKSFSQIKAHILVVNKGDDIVAGLPLYEVTSLYNGRRLVSIPLATLSDPLAVSDEQLQKLLQNAVRLGRDYGSTYLEVRTRETVPLMKGLGIKPFNSSFVNHFLYLKNRPEDLLRTFDRSCVRQRIARAEKSGISVRIMESDQDVTDFYRLYVITRRRIGLPPIPMAFVRSMAEVLCTKGKAKMYLAIHQGIPIAGLFVLKYKNRVSAEILGTDDRFMKVSPNHYLFWQAIKEACQEGYEIFDFGRTDRANSSLMDFKARWGTQVIEMPIYHLPERNMGRSDLRFERYYLEFAKRAIRHMPVSICVKFGAIVYRHFL
jgi:CelD/BcsL family acetyltransferase involved in cellulose biosynthesis